MGCTNVSNNIMTCQEGEMAENQPRKRGSKKQKVKCYD